MGIGKGGFLKGGLLRLLELFLLFLCFCCGGIILGVYSYFLAILADRNLPVKRDWKAVEGISGAACLWLFVATFPMCCCGHKRFMAMLLAGINVAFCAGFIALAVLTRNGADSCSGNVKTPIGSGPADSNSLGYGANGFGFGDGENATYAPNLHLACRLNTAAFAVSLIGALLFALAALVNIALGRHKRSEAAYGPSPSNNYTSGRPARNWKSWITRSKKDKEYENPDSLPHMPVESTLADDKKADYGAPPTNNYASAGSYHTGSNAYGNNSAYTSDPYATAPTTTYGGAPYGEKSVAPAAQQPAVSSHNALLKSENSQNPYAAV